MPSRRGAISLSDTEQEEFLNQGWTLQVASIGQPSVQRCGLSEPTLSLR